MRVMFTMWPAPAHFYPALPLAWALQGAGHEVCVASAHDLAETVTGAGLTAVPLGDASSTPSLELETVISYALDGPAREELEAALVREEADREPMTMFSTYVMTSMRMFHTPGGARTPGAAPDRLPGVDGLVEFARDWQPDLVLWDSVWPGAAVAARAVGAAHARQLWGPDYCGWATERLGTGAANPLAEMMRPLAARYGQEVDDELLRGQWTVDPTPPELRLAVKGRTVSVRRVPYTGVGVFPDWLHPKPRRPRVALSLGVSARKIGGPESMIEHILEVVSGLDIEVIATLDEEQLAGRRVPDNVRTVDFVPLNQLLPTCDAVIHHGGGGTLTAALAHKVPQLIVMEGMEASAYSAHLASYGAGLTVDHRSQSVPEIRKALLRVLEEPSFREGTERLHASWLAMPSPNDVVPSLEKLTALHRVGR
ncbi:nucleotide disphospho-sugar-binding domain-containing protein [Streptomyces sp. NPDC051561]|uniref:nucleotide disphospho-sugar-binding domain-containing protein n=1 Tax=Streptomyces sp. NPDC051561 TaxID=3365658 RepID=UPI0037AE9766